MSEIEIAVARAFGCPAETAAVIARRATSRRFALHAVIVRQGEPSPDTFLLIVGRARAALLTADGRLVQLMEFAPGELFGALDAALTEPVEVAAAEPCVTAVFRAVDFLVLIETHACVGRLAARLLVTRLALVIETMRARLDLTVPGRVAAELLRLAAAGDGRSVRPAPLMTQLAARVQSTRETVSRAVSGFERRGLVQRVDGGLLLPHPARLEALVV